MKKRKKLKLDDPQPTHRNGHPVKFRIPWGVRKIIIKRDGLVCKYCDAELTIKTHTIDHILPVSKGGTENPHNLVMCCGWCNKKAKDILFHSFEAKRAYLLNLREEKIHNQLKSGK